MEPPHGCGGGMKTISELVEIEVAKRPHWKPSAIYTLRRKVRYRLQNRCCDCGRPRGAGAYCDRCMVMRRKVAKNRYARALRERNTICPRCKSKKNQEVDKGKFNCMNCRETVWK